MIYYYIRNSAKLGLKSLVNVPTTEVCQMSTRAMVWLAAVSTYAFIAFIAGLFGPLNWFIAPIFGFTFCKWSGWRMVWTMSLSLLLGGSLGWLWVSSYIVPFHVSLLGSTFTVLLFLGGALACQLKHSIKGRPGSDTPSNPSSGGNSMFRRLLPKWRQEDRNSSRLQASVIPTA